jgi:hypothetical protein
VLQAKAQTEAWVMGNQWISFMDPNGSYTLNPLPTAPNGYQGQIAQRSQLARTNAEGQLLFFIVDGAIYDGRGVLIADNDVQGCTECVPKGCTKVLAIPVPTPQPDVPRCGLFYIITSNPSDLAGEAGVLVGLLDMNAPNPHDPTGRGRLLNMATDLSFPPYDNFDNVFYPLTGTWLSDHMVKLPSTNPGQKGGWIELAAIDPRWISGSNAGNWLVHATYADRIVQYYVQPDGIVEHWTLDVGTNSPGTNEWAHSSQFGFSPFSGTCWFAATQDGSWVVDEPPTLDYYPIIVLQLETNTGNVITNHGYNAGTTGFDGTDHIFGVGFDEQSFKLFYTRSGTGTHLGVIDLGTGVATDLQSLPNLVIPNSATRVYTSIEPNISLEGGAPNTLFYAHSSGLSALTVPNGFVPSSWSWTDVVPFSQPLGTVPLCQPNWADLTPPRLLNGQMINDPHLQQQSERCCAFSELIDGPVGETHIIGTINNWYPGNNGLPGDPLEGEFLQDLVVDPGATLVVQNMTMRFGPDAHIVVKPGGYARFLNCTLTSASCDGSRWKGIRVNGHSNLDQNPTIHGDQGYVYLSGTTVRNAEMGAICATEQAGGGYDPNGYGGILRCSNSFFRNCVTGADIPDYHMNYSAGVENNLCSFANTSFVIDTDWPDAMLPQWQLVVRNTRQVDVSYCSFTNDAPQLFPPDQSGYGILVAAAQANVIGNNNPGQSYVRGFRIGILNTMSTFTPLTVNGMHFSNNVWGIADFGSLFARYVNNEFTVPDQGVAPSPRVGMLLWQTQLMTVERNTFKGQDPQQEANENAVGIFHLGLNSQNTLPGDNNWVYIDNRIYDNVFKDLTVGNLVQWVNRGHGATDQASGLQLLCGDYTNNQLDHAVLPQSILRPNQGEPVAGQQLGGNRYFDPADCTSNFDWWLDPSWNDIPGWYPDMTVTYYHHEEPTALVDPLCVNNDYSDEAVPFSGVFDKPISCGNGLLDATLPTGVVRSQLALATEQWDDAQLALDGLVRAANEEDILDAVNAQNEPMSSSALRNLLLASSPLSDELLVAVIERSVAMDPWHLTQVMTANSKLNDGVLKLLRNSELLGPFHMNIVEQAQLGVGPSAKQQLEQELHQRRSERTRAITDLGWRFGTDSLDVGGLDSLRRMILNEPDEEFVYQVMQGLVQERDWVTLDGVLQTNAGKLNGAYVFEELLTSGQSVAGDWSALSPLERASLLGRQLEERAGAAYAAGLLKSIEPNSVMPVVQVPRIVRAMVHSNEPSSLSLLGVVFSAFPNPGGSVTYLTSPMDAKGMGYEFLDLLGRVVLKGNLSTSGLTEVGINSLPGGLYKVLVPGTEHVFSFAVAH